jgi:anti-anti-sigma factor
MTRHVPPAHFSIDQTLDGERHRLALHGELDLESAPALESKLREALAGGSKHLVLDLSDLQFVDSTGLALFVRAHQAAESNGHELTLTGRTPQVQRLFELTGVLDRFTFN